MAINQFYDETAGHQVVQAAMVEARPLLRSALLGAYVELVSMTQKAAVAAVDAGLAAEHVDGLVTLGDIVSIEPWATDELLDALIHYRYLEHTNVDGRYRLIPHRKLAHWEPAEVLAWRKEKRRDCDDPVMRRLVRYRDGDQCRVCHKIVLWGVKNTNPEGGTLDHIEPRHGAKGDPEALAVTCRECNGIRSDRPDANEFAPHQPVPEVPYYTESTARMLRENGFKRPDGTPIRKTGEKWLLPRIPITARPAPKADTAHRDPAASGTPRSSGRPDAVDQGTVTARPALKADTAHRDPAASGTPRQPEVHTKSARSSPEVHNANFQPTPPPTRENNSQRVGGYGGGKGRGKGQPRAMGEGQAVRSRRRARRSKPVSREESS